MAKKDQTEKNRKAAQKLKEKIALQLKRGAGKGVEAAVRFLEARMKEAVSVPAPKRAIRGRPLPGKRLGPILGYRATTPAVKGAPPRVVSGKLRSGITHKMLTPYVGIVGTHARSLPSARYSLGFDYPRYLELGKEDRWGEGKHQFIRLTARKYRREMRTIVGTEIRFQLKRKV